MKRKLLVTSEGLVITLAEAIHSSYIIIVLDNGDFYYYKQKDLILGSMRGFSDNTPYPACDLQAHINNVIKAINS